MVDYLFGKPVVINSAAPDPARREIISELLRMIIAQHGGIVFLQQLALLGTVYGYIDVLVKFDASPSADQDPNHTGACSTQDVGQPPACDGDSPYPVARASSAAILPPDGAGPSATAAGNPVPVSNDQGTGVGHDDERSAARASDASS